MKEEDQNTEFREEIRQLKEEIFNKNNKMYWKVIKRDLIETQLENQRIIFENQKNKLKIEKETYDQRRRDNFKDSINFSSNNSILYISNKKKKHL